MRVTTKFELLLCALLVLLTFGAARPAVAQENVPGICQDPPQYRLTVPLWGYKVTATRGDKKGYTGTMVGKCPFAKGKNQDKTSVKTLVVWVQLAIKDDQGIQRMFDPAATNPCLVDDKDPPQAHSVKEVVSLSPILKNYGRGDGYGDVGEDDVLQNSAGNQIKTQYGDFFQRANFWVVIDDGSGKLGGSSNYQTVLDPVADKTAPLPELPGGTARALPGQQCGDYQQYAGYIEFKAWVNALERINLGVVPPDTFMIFVLDSVQLCQTVAGDPSGWLNTCIAGYHSAAEVKDDNGTDLYTWAVSDFDNAGLFPKEYGDVSTLSHEVGEWMDNPVVLGDWFAASSPGNQVPAWGDGIGQVLKDQCQKNLEVGDPLSQGQTNPWTITLSQPFPYTYHLQELAYYSWFFGPPTIGAGDKSVETSLAWFSNHGTFTVAAPDLKPGFIANCQAPPGP